MRGVVAGGTLPLAGLLLLVATSASGEGLESRARSGPVEATVEVEPAAPRIGDPVLLQLSVRAEPGVELLMPEFGDALDRFRIVDFAPSEEIGDDGATLARQRYTLQPARSGPQTVPPLLVEFVDRRPGREAAPEGSDAHELLTEALAFDVEAALPEGAPLDYRPAAGVMPPHARPGAVWPIALGAGVLLAAAAFLAWRWWAAGAARRRQRSAYDVARAGLDELLHASRPGPEEMDGFYVQLSGLVRRYLEDRFALRSPELTTEEFLVELSESPDLVRGHQDLLRGFLRGADLVKFAHHVPGPDDVEASLQAAARFLEATRGREGADSGAARGDALRAGGLA